MSERKSDDNSYGKRFSLYRIPYEFTQDIVRSVAFTGEVERIGSQQMTAFFDVVASSPELALAAWVNEYGNREKYPKGERFAVQRVGEPVLFCDVDKIIEIHRGWIG